MDLIGRRDTLSELNKHLDRLRTLLTSSDFLESKGLSNEVNIQIFCYHPEDEMIVRQFIKQILKDQSLPCRVINKNLYEIFLQNCEKKRILEKIPGIEEKKGTKYLQNQLKKAIPTQSYVDSICEEPFEAGDVLLLTGVGDVFPFMRVHNLLEALQPKIDYTPIIVMYPGEYDGRNFSLFDRLPKNPYYRAFNVI